MYFPVANSSIYSMWSNTTSTIIRQHIVNSYHFIIHLPRTQVYFIPYLFKFILTWTASNITSCEMVNRLYVDKALLKLFLILKSYLIFCLVGMLWNTDITFQIENFISFWYQMRLYNTSCVTFWRSLSLKQAKI